MLSDSKIKAVKATGKQQKLTDGDSMYLFVTPAGKKYWRLKYYFQGVEKVFSIGPYPEIGLSAAREKRRIVKEQLVNGIDPNEEKKAKKASYSALVVDSFESIAREWHQRFAPTWTPDYADKQIVALQRDAFPWIGARPILEIKAVDILGLLRRVESRNALDTAYRLKTIIGQVFRYGVATGRAERDPTADLRGALPPNTTCHYASIIEPKEVAPLLRAIDGYTGSFVVKCALRLSPLLFVRPGELRGAEWGEIDLDEAVWSIPAEKMKMRAAHLVPLSAQAVAILEELKPLTGKGKYVFPSGRTSLRTISENTVNAALRSLGYSKDKITGHGFRAMARTILDEVLQVRPDYIEHQLAHAVKDPNGRAYNRTKFWKERQDMMQLWADYLDGLKNGAKVLPLKQKEAV